MSDTETLLLALFVAISVVVIFAAWVAVNDPDGFG